MLKGVHGWKHESLNLFTHLRNEFFHTTKMASNPGHPGNSRLVSNTSSVPDAPPRTGAGGARIKSRSELGLSSNTHEIRTLQGKASFGGLEARKSRLPAANIGAEGIQFGSFEIDPVPSDTRGDRESLSLPDDLDPVQVSNVQPVAVDNKEINQVAMVDRIKGQASQKSKAQEVHPVAVKNVHEENTVLQPPKVSPRPNWTNKDAELNKRSDPSPSFSFASGTNEDFPALGAPSVPKARMPKGQPWKAEVPERPKPETVLTLKPTADTRVVVSPMRDARREAGTASAEWGEHEREEQNKFKRGRGGGRHSWRDGGGEWRDPIDALGRTLTRILRHQALNLQIKLRSDGYADVNELLNLPMTTVLGRPLNSYTVADVLQAVKLDTKQRFGIKEEHSVLFIRANQGHSIKAVETEQLLEPVLTAEKVPVCVHGTFRKNWPSIAKEGLKRMGRNHVHFARGLTPTDGVVSGMRKTSDILIFLDVSKALKDGMKLFISENGVILTEGFGGVVPPKYFKDVRSWPDDKPVNF